MKDMYTCDMQPFVLSCNFIIACCILSDSPCQTLFSFLDSNLCVIQYNIFLLQLGFHLVTVVLTLAYKKARTVICIKRNNVYHSTHNRKQIFSLGHIRFMREH